QARGPALDRECPRSQAEDPLQPGAAPDLGTAALDPHQGAGEATRPMGHGHARYRRDRGKDSRQPVGGRGVDGAGEDPGHRVAASGHAGNVAGGANQGVDAALRSSVYPEPAWLHDDQPPGVAQPSGRCSNSAHWETTTATAGSSPASGGSNAFRTCRTASGRGPRASSTNSPARTSM